MLGNLYILEKSLGFFTKHLYVKSIHKKDIELKFCDIQCVNWAPFSKYFGFQWPQGKH